MSAPTRSAAQHPASRSSDALPAAQVTAEIYHHSTHVNLVVMPARFAKEAAMRYIQRHDPAARVITGPADLISLGLSLGADQWAFDVARTLVSHLGLVFTHESVRGPLRTLLVYRRHTVLIERPHTQFLLRSFEKSKPEELDEQGRPMAWIPVKRRFDAVRTGDGPDLGDGRDGGEDGEADAILLPEGATLPPTTATAPSTGTPFIDDLTIARWFATLAATAGYPRTPELDLVRGSDEKNGFTAGRVWFSPNGPARRVRLVTCPNSDLAEVLATIAHELAHPLSGATGHNDGMKAAFIELVSKQWGTRFFAYIAGHLGSERMRTVDYWVASGIRAALRGAEAPAPKSGQSGGDGNGGDDGQMARVMSRLKKLRSLARDQVGRPEGIAATGAANDIVTLHGLGHYGVGDAEIDETQIVDRFVVLPDGSVWRRMLAHEVADYCEVFALSLPSEGRMHFFGAYADVVAAEYLFSVSAARIESDCRDHLAAWKKKRGKTSSADTRKEKTSFCDCAAMEFGKKLTRIRKEEGDGDGTDSVRTREAEEVARHEHGKRGTGWASSGSKTYRENAAGRAAGAAMEVMRGVGGAGASAGALGLKR